MHKFPKKGTLLQTAATHHNSSILYVGQKPKIGLAVIDSRQLALLNRHYRGNRTVYTVVLIILRT